MQRTHRVGLVAGVALAITAAVACGLSVRGDEDAGPIGLRDRDSAAAAEGATTFEDASTSLPDDAAPIADAALDVTILPEIDAGTDSGPRISYGCEGSLDVTSCTLCLNRPTPCIFCKLSDGSLKGECIAANEACYYNVPPSYDVCRCTARDASACPSFGSQVCNTFDNGYCQPCGDDFSNGFPCRSGGTCTEATGLCQ